MLGIRNRIVGQSQLMAMAYLFGGWSFINNLKWESEKKTSEQPHLAPHGKIACCTSALLSKNSWDFSS